LILVNEKQRKTRVSHADGENDALVPFPVQGPSSIESFKKQVMKRREKEKGDKTEIKRNHPDATPQFASPNQLSEHGISFHQPMAPIKSLFGFRVARVVMSEQG